jgi:hypothetical protein
MANSVGEGIGQLRQVVLKQSLGHQDQIAASTLLDAYQAQLTSLGVGATTASAGTATTAAQALQGLNSQLNAATGLSGYPQGAMRDLTARLVADLAAHNVAVTS